MRASVVLVCAAAVVGVGASAVVALPIARHLAGQHLGEPPRSAMPVAPRQSVGPLHRDQVILPPQAFGNLTVFPVVASSREDIEPMATLPIATAKGEAFVREALDASGPSGDGVEEANEQDDDVSLAFPVEIEESRKRSAPRPGGHRRGRGRSGTA